MEKTALWNILLHLSPVARKEIGKMMRSPFFNQREEVSTAFVLINKAIDSKKQLSRAELHDHIYPKQVFDGAKIRTLVFQLTEIVRKYLILSVIETKPVYSKLLLAEALRGIEADEWEQEALSDAYALLQEEQYKGTEWHDLQFQLLTGLMRQSAGTSRTQTISFQVFSDSLDKAFMLRRLKLSCELISHQAVYKTTYERGLLDLLLAYLGAHPFWLEQPDIALYYHCSLALLNPSETRHFEQLKPLLLQAEAVFPPPECRDILLLTLNFCIRKLNEGDVHFAHEGLELYQHALKQGYLLEKGQISRFTFRNIVGMGLKIEAFDWVEYFILTYRDKLPPEHHESMVSFNLARLAYIRQRYGEAIGLLQKADYQDLLLNLAARVLLLKIYYETHAFRPLEAALDAAKIFLRRKKIIGYHRDNYQNIFRYFEKLLTLNPFDAAERKTLQSALEQEEHLTERDWFLKVLQK
jgi:hypothetical protein